MGNILAEVFQFGLHQIDFKLANLFKVGSSIFLLEAECGNVIGKLFKISFFELFNILAHGIKLVGFNFIETFLYLSKILLGIFGIKFCVLKLFGKLFKLRLGHSADILAKIIRFKIKECLSSAFDGIKIA